MYGSFNELMISNAFSLLPVLTVMIAVHLSKEDQLQSGVYEDQIRISVGIEDIEDLKKDFETAIRAVNA